MGATTPGARGVVRVPGLTAAFPGISRKSTCLYLPFYDRDYGRRVARLVLRTVDPRRYTGLLLSHCGFDPPSSPSSDHPPPNAPSRSPMAVAA